MIVGGSLQGFGTKVRKSPPLADRRSHVWLIPLIVVFCYGSADLFMDQRRRYSTKPGFPFSVYQPKAGYTVRSVRCIELILNSCETFFHKNKVNNAGFSVFVKIGVIFSGV